jgi:hypothetical protein
MTTAQWAWVAIDAVALVAVLGAGVWLGALNDEPTVITETIYRPTGDFHDVVMVMPTAGGNTFRFNCDLHFPDQQAESLEPTEPTAECEYIEP